MNDYNKISVASNILIEKIKQLCSNKDKISLLEIDLIKDDIKKLYKLVSELQVSPMSTVHIQESISHTQEPVEFSPMPTVHNQEPIEQIIETAEYNEENQVPIPVVEEKPDNTKNVTIIEEPISPVIVPKKTEKETENQSKVKPASDTDLFSKAEQVTLSEKLDDKKPSLNEMISQQKTDKSIAEKIHRASDIKDLIGINEKYLFINNLFNGDMQVYNSFIDSLNKASDNSLALNIINSAKDLHKWKEDSEAYLKLVDIVSTKFYM